MRDLVNQVLLEIPDKSISVIYLEANDINKFELSCLVDTGANTPIWFAGVDYLKECFKGAEETPYKTIISGLGQKPYVNVPVYKIPVFKLVGIEVGELIYHDLLIPVLEAKKANTDMIISLTMLNRMDFSFSYNNSITKGYLNITFSKPNYYIKPIFSHNLLDKIQVFYQDEIH